MDERKFDDMLRRVLKHDFTAGTESFRDELLARCLAVVNADMRAEPAEAHADCRVIELDDADLELLAAAGDSDASSVAFNDASR